MSKINFFHGLINSLFDKPIKRRPFNFFSEKKQPLSSKDIIENVASARGEVSALEYAELLMQHCEKLNDKDLINFFKLIRDNFDISTSELSEAIDQYKVDSNSENLITFMKLSEPKRREIFRRCNGISKGTIRLVNLRKRLLGLLKKNPELNAVDYDLVYLFKNWFNRGFLILRPINWETPAHILEKIIAYEAVHEINSWDELRLRLAPKDRRCFAFFHPLMPNEPLIFVEVALSNKIPNTIKEIIALDRSVTLDLDINTAVFYSISNCQEGLSGISFGNFLIKQVAHKLKQENDKLEKFVTLSPAPGFVRWLNDKSIDEGENEEILLKQALIYLTSSDRKDELPNDPVAKFHLGNGAILERINLNADLSSKGLNQSKGVMVNYLYNLETLEENHELFFKTKEVKQSDAIKSLRKKLQIQ